MISHNLNLQRHGANESMSNCCKPCKELIHYISQLQERTENVSTHCYLSLLDVVWDMPLSTVCEDTPMETFILDHQVFCLTTDGSGVVVYARANRCWEKLCR